MKNFMGAIYEHLITKRKYNKLKIKLDVKQAEYEKKVVEFNTEKRIYKEEKNIWENKIKEKEQQIINLTEKIENQELEILDLKERIEKKGDRYEED